MPQIDKFDGITIEVHYRNEHNPPHFHATYQQHAASFYMRGNLLIGDMPAKKKKRIWRWAQKPEKQTLLWEHWELAMNNRK